MLSEWTLVDGPEEVASHGSVARGRYGSGRSRSRRLRRSRTAPWQLSWIEPLRVVGRTSVVGLFLDPRLELSAVEFAGAGGDERRRYRLLDLPGWSQGIEVEIRRLRSHLQGIFRARFEDGGFDPGIGAVKGAAFGDGEQRPDAG